jgi:hypothetical protein
MGYAAGIVVRRTRDEAGAHDIRQLRPIRLFDLVGVGSNIHLRDFCRLAETIRY